MKYFGTDLRDHGHYTWDLTGHYMEKIGLLPKDTPFNPEELTKGLPKGEVAYYQGGGFSVIAIAGSCRDDRPGTKSVFWVKELIDRDDLIIEVLSSKLSGAIIQAMNFAVMWPANLKFTTAYAKKMSYHELSERVKVLKEFVRSGLIRTAKGLPEDDLHTIIGQMESALRKIEQSIGVFHGPNGSYCPNYGLSDNPDGNLNHRDIDKPQFQKDSPSPGEG